MLRLSKQSPPFLINGFSFLDNSFLKARVSRRLCSTSQSSSDPVTQNKTGSRKTDESSLVSSEVSRYGKHSHTTSSPEFPLHRREPNKALRLIAFLLAADLEKRIHKGCILLCTTAQNPLIAVSSVSFLEPSVVYN